MMPKIKNAIIFLIIGIVFFALYSIFIKKDDTKSALVTNTAISTTTQNTNTSQNPNKDITKNSQLAKDFLSLLLNVKGITLNDSLFVDEAFTSLRDSSILLIQDGNEGRPNPFAPIGVDMMLQDANDSLDLTTPPSNIQKPNDLKNQSQKQMELESQMNKELSNMNNVQLGVPEFNIPN